MSQTIFVRLNKAGASPGAFSVCHENRKSLEYEEGSKRRQAVLSPKKDKKCPRNRLCACVCVSNFPTKHSLSILFIRVHKWYKRIPLVLYITSAKTPFNFEVRIILSLILSAIHVYSSIFCLKYPCIPRQYQYLRTTE